MRVGVVGGTGFGPLLADADRVLVETPWGSVDVGHRRDGDVDLFLVQRHGARKLPPHKIAHRANVDALARCRVDAILAVNAVGALHAGIAVPSLVVPDDLVDARKTTETFFDERAVHVDLSEPYCPTLRGLLLREAQAARDGGVHVAVEGPRLETRAEVRMLRGLGGDVVGMTGSPEATLARERALCYASLCLVVNAAAGVLDAPLTARVIRAGAEALAPDAMRAVVAAARALPETRACRCRDALDGAALE